MAWGGGSVMRFWNSRLGFALVMVAAVAYLVICAHIGLEHTR